MEVKDKHLWGLAVATFGVGDAVTTEVGLDIDGVVEENETAKKAGLVSSAETIGVSKLAMLAGAGLAYTAVPEPHNKGIPVGLTALGTAVTIHNITVINKASEVSDNDQG